MWWQSWRRHPPPLAVVTSANLSFCATSSLRIFSSGCPILTFLAPLRPSRRDVPRDLFVDFSCTYPPRNKQKTMLGRKGPSGPHEDPEFRDTLRHEKSPKCLVEHAPWDLEAVHTHKEMAMHISTLPLGLPEGRLGSTLLWAVVPCLTPICTIRKQDEQAAWSENPQVALSCSHASAE